MVKKPTILGVHFGHDSGAAILKDGRIVADVSEERFNRIKHSADYPINSIRYCLKEAGISLDEVDEIAVAGTWQDDSFEVVFGRKLPGDHPRPMRLRIKEAIFGRLLKTVKTPVYSRGLYLKHDPKITVVDHHLAHAASAYYTSGFDGKMLIFTIDGVGDGNSTCVWKGHDGKIEPLAKFGAEGSIGWFYSNVTEAIGWWHGDGEGKTMGLAPYGDFTKCEGCLEGYYPKYEDGRLVSPKKYPRFGMFRLGGAIHWHSEEALEIQKLAEKYGREDLAAEAQRILEEQVKNIVFPWMDKEGIDTIATAGGVFLNVKLNQRLWMSGKISNHLPYANPGDSGLALGAALHASAIAGIIPEIKHYNLYCGPGYGDEEIRKILEQRGIGFRKSDNPSLDAAKYLEQDKIVAWFQGRMEAGPRALGNRSILMSPKKAENKDIINARVKFREAFRPFCPSMAVEAINDYLVNPRMERYMVTSFDCVEDKKQDIPAVVHADGTLRPQTVAAEDNPRYHALITEFGRLTGTPVVLNTSMNIMGEPIVCSPIDAIRCFYGSGIDALFLGDYVVEKQADVVRQ